MMTNENSTWYIMITNTLINHAEVMLQDRIIIIYSTCVFHLIPPRPVALAVVYGRMDIVPQLGLCPPQSTQPGSVPMHGWSKADGA